LRKTYPTYETQPDFFVRMATAYQKAGKTEHALAAAADGVARHPEDADLYLAVSRSSCCPKATPRSPAVSSGFPTSGKLLALEAQYRRKHGDLQGALDATRRAVLQDSTLARGYLQLAQAYLDVDKNDSELVALESGLHRAPDSSVIGQFALARATRCTAPRTFSKKRADFEIAPPPSAKLPDDGGIAARCNPDSSATSALSFLSTSRYACASCR